MTATVRVLEDGPHPLLVPEPYRVVDRITEASDVHTLHVVPTTGELPPFRPAQVSMLGVFGVGEAAISISSPVAERDHHAYTIRRAGPISSALVDTPVDGEITVRGPFGRPWPLGDIDTSNLLVVAGGLGLAPLRAAIHEAFGERHRFHRIVVLYGAKTPADLLYRREFGRWRDLGAEVDVSVDVGDDEWSGPVGLVPDRLVSGAPDVDWSDTTAFVCGPDVMMDVTARRLIDLGMPTERIWLTLERNMQCGNGLCGHCQLGPLLVCRDGPVASYATIGRFHRVPAL